MKSIRIAAITALVAAAITLAPGQVRAQAGAQPWVNITKGWNAFNSGDAESAVKYFTAATKVRETAKDAWFGLASAFQRLKKYDEAIKICLEHKKENKNYDRIRLDSMSERALASFEKKEYADAVKDIEAVLPERDDAGLRSILAWSYFQLGEDEKAFDIFMAHFEKTGDPADIDPIIAIGDRNPALKPRVDNLVDSFAKSENPKLRKILADLKYKEGHPRCAAAIYDGPDTCYRNANRPRLSVYPTYRSKSGDPGTTRLNAITVPLTYAHPVGMGWEVYATAAYVSLDADPAPKDYPYLGTFYHLKLLRTPTSKVNGMWGRIGLLREGDISFDGYIGSTTSGGAVSPTPAFSAQAKGKWWRLRAYRTPIEETILSSVGLKDPFGDGVWGRVVRTGGELELSTKIFEPFWFSVSGFASDISGYNTWPNSEVGAGLSTGRKFDLKTFDFSTGVFLSYQSFRRNTNSMLYGHGGYYSPQIFLVTGLTLGISSKECQRTRWLLEAGVTNNYAKTDDAPNYPTIPQPPTNELIMKGSKADSLGYTGKAELGYLITPSVEIAANYSINKSSGYTEWIAGVYLAYLFGPRTAFASYNP